MKNLKKHFEEKYQLLLTESQLVEIARAALEDCKPEIIGQHITEPELTVDDLVKGEWYAVAYEGIKPVGEHKIFLIHYKCIFEQDLHCFKGANCLNKLTYHYESALCPIKNIKSIRPATREEIIKYFPHEFEIESHGGNDIPRVTDEQL